MASLAELYDLTNSQALKERVAAAVILAAVDNLPNADATIKAWAGKAVRSGLGDVAVVVRLFLHANKDETKAEIESLNDAVINTVVAGLVPGLAASDG